jgi:hypothetical protein
MNTSSNKKPKLIGSIQSTLQHASNICSEFEEISDRIQQEFDAKIRDLDEEQNTEIDRIKKLYKEKRDEINKQAQEAIQKVSNKPHEQCYPIVKILCRLLDCEVVIVPNSDEFDHINTFLEVLSKYDMHDFYNVFSGIATIKDCDIICDFFTKNVKSYSLYAKLQVSGPLEGYKGRETEFYLRDTDDYTDADLPDEFISNDSIKNRKLHFDECVDWEQAWLGAMEDIERTDDNMDDRIAHGIAKLAVVAYHLE